LERTPLIPLFALEEEIVHLQTIAIVPWDSLEINVKHLFVLERILQIQVFALEKEIVNLQIIVFAQVVSQEINVKRHLQIHQNHPSPQESPQSNHQLHPLSTIVLENFPMIQLFVHHVELVLVTIIVLVVQVDTLEINANSLVVLERILLTQLFVPQGDFVYL
jgi:hypothetical protein